MNQRAYFNEKAFEWDTYMPAAQQARLAPLVDRFGLQPGMHVIDLGAGTGVMVPYLHCRIGPHGHITVIDCAERMLSVAQRKYPVTGCLYCAADAHALPLRTRQYHAAVCFNCFPHFADKVSVLRAIGRILRPGARAIVAHSASREDINALHNDVGDVVKHDRIPPRDAMYALFSQAGYTHITIDEGPETYLAWGTIPA